MTAKVTGPNPNLLSLKPLYADTRDVEGGVSLVRQDLIKRPKSLIEKIGVVVKDPAAADSIFKLIKQFSDLVQEIQPSAALEKVGSLFGKARAASAPFYLLKTVTDVVHADYKSVNSKLAQAWLDMIEAATINWNIWSSMLLERSDKIVGQIGTFAGLGSDVISLVNLGVDVHETSKNITANVQSDEDVLVRLKEERGIQWAKIAAVVASIAGGVFAILAFTLGISPVPAIVLLTIAVAGTAIKVGATFYEKTREEDLFDAPQMV
ncbi:MAG TPA: hypothetical protein DCE71_07440 [Parachlamydiales bacterium]|nr:hypothetical protein [Parachlamydiales bacterium]